MGSKKVWILKNLRSIDNLMIEKQIGEDLNRYYCASFKTEHWTILNNYNSVSINLNFYPFDVNSTLAYKITRDTPLMLCPTVASYGGVSYVDFKLAIYLDNGTFKIENPMNAYNRNQYMCYLTKNQINKLSKYLSVMPNDLLQSICSRIYNSRNETFEYKYRNKFIKVFGL